MSILDKAHQAAALINQHRGLIEGQISHITVPSGTTSIRSRAFQQVSGLKTVTLPEGLTSVGSDAFSGTGLTKLEMPSTITSIGARAFYNCPIKTITWSNSLESIGDSAFNSNRSYTGTLTLPSSLRTIGKVAFNYWSMYEKLILPHGLTSIDYEAFAQNITLSALEIPNTLTTIGNGVFRQCTHLFNVTIETGFNADNLDLSASTGYSADKIVTWLNALADRTGLSTYTLNIGEMNLAKLTAEQIAIATNKNWNIT